MTGDEDVDASASMHCTLHTLSQNWSKMAEIKGLEGRLRVLEEEAQVLRGVFLESLEGRAKIMGEIHDTFEKIQDCLMLKQQGRGEICCNGDEMIISPLKGRRAAGLLQVLGQEPNPSLVYGSGLKAKALG